MGTRSGIRRSGLVGLVAISVLLGPQPAAGTDVAIYGSPDAAWYDIQSKLMSTGLFTTVYAHTIHYYTPTLAEMQSYDAVMISGSSGYFEHEDLGDDLADYIDGGGGVVLAGEMFYDTGNNVAIEGRFRDDGYFPVTPAYSGSMGSFMWLVPDVPNHPILDGVITFNGGENSSHSCCPTVVPGAAQVASWDNGELLVATHQPAPGRVVALNMVAASEDYHSTCWDTDTDGARLLANAMLYAARALDLDCDDYSTDGGDCDDYDAAVNPGVAEDCGDGIDNDCDGDIDIQDSDCTGDDDDDDDDSAGDDDSADDDDSTDDDDTGDDDDSQDDDDAFEGDEPGECTDGADNDMDGLFDCDDSDCEGSPDCQGCKCSSTAISPPQPAKVLLLFCLIGIVVSRRRRK